MIGQYPNIKVILTIREENKWFRSWCNTVNAAKSLVAADPKFHEIKNEAVYRMYAQWMGSTEISTFDPFKIGNNACQHKELYIGRYNKHNEEVIQGVPKENLLILNIADVHYDDWEELCTFLEVPIPSVPFPHTKKGDANEMLETSKPKTFSEKKIEAINVPPDHLMGRFLFEFCIFGVLCVLIYVYMMGDIFRNLYENSTFKANFMGNRIVEGG